MPSFTSHLWESISDNVYPKILAHPFLLGLQSGSLSESSFKFYIRQDSLYLREFGRGLALIAAKAPTPEAFMMFCEHARNTLIVEGALHQGFEEAWEGAMHEHSEKLKAPTCQAYTAFLLNSCRDQGYVETLAAFLPCYWIYLKVGRQLVENGSPNPLFKKWIDTYSGDAFEKVVNEILEEMDRSAESCDPDTLERATKNFYLGSLFEYRFWDMAFKEERWL